MPSKAQHLFASKAPWIMELLRRDFSLSMDEAAAILGNLGHECGGFALMQEQKPTVKGSRGGYGWAQWTGPRRRAFEAYCTRNKLPPDSDRANYGWLFVELSTSEAGALPALKRAGALAEKVKAFEQHFERAGVKHYPSRNQWAARALDAYHAAGTVTLPDWADVATLKEQTAPPAPKPKGEQPTPPTSPGGETAGAKSNGSAGKALGVVVLAIIAAVLYLVFGAK